MIRFKSCFVVFFLIFCNIPLFAHDNSAATAAIDLKNIIGSWTFSGTLRNENSEQYGYFFEIQREKQEFHVKTALIDGQNNQLLFFYEQSEKIDSDTPLDWHIGQAFIRHNSITDSWVFGVKSKDKKGFNFKVDMLSQSGNSNLQTLRPGVRLLALQTSQLNGHILINDKEEFVTGNQTWFSQLIFDEVQKDSQDINVAYCRLSNQEGFYSAKVKEKNNPKASVAEWLDANGNKVKMSQFVSVTNQAEQCTVTVGIPKLTLKLSNTLKDENILNSVAGFSKENKNAFCFVSNQSFFKENYNA